MSCVGAEYDLALLTEEEPSFWEDLRSLPLGSPRALHSTVYVIGSPRGGESLCVTAGAVSRVEMQHTLHAASDVVAVKMDTGINYGASGEPALNSPGEVVCGAFQADYDAENIGYLIAEDILRHILSDFDHTEGVQVLKPALQKSSLGMEILRMQVKEDGGRDFGHKPASVDTPLLIVFQGT